MATDRSVDDPGKRCQVAQCMITAVDEVDLGIEFLGVFKVLHFPEFQVCRDHNRDIYNYPDKYYIDWEASSITRIIRKRAS